MTIWMPAGPEANERLSRCSLALVIAMPLDEQVDGREGLQPGRWT